MQNEITTVAATIPEASQDSLNRRQRRQVVTRTVASLIGELKDQQERVKDLLVPYSDLRAAAIRIGHESYELHLSCGSKGSFPVYGKVLQQICTHVQNDKRTTMNKNYLNIMLEDNSNESRLALAATNINHWLVERSNEQHYKGRGTNRREDGEKQVLVRTIFDKDQEQYVVRALLSDRYFIYPSLDMVATALGAVSQAPGDEEEMASGARVFDWKLTEFDLNLGFINPAFAFDMRNPDKGVQRADISFDKDVQGEQGKFMYAGGTYDRNGWKSEGDNGGGNHYVFPAAFLKNSDTGSGSASIQMMFLEAVCDNTCKIGIDAKRTHIGSRLDEGFESDETRKKRIQFVTSSFKDALMQVFNASEFEKNCKKFLGLFEQEVKGVKETFEHVSSKLGLTDGILDDLLTKYNQFNSGKDSVGDIQRAITDVAQDQPDDVANTMESYAGDLVSGEVKIDKKLLVTA